MALGDKDTREAVSVRFNDGTAKFTQADSYPVGPKPNTLVAVDLDGDTHVDLATSSEVDFDVSVLSNDGTASFESKLVLSAGGAAFRIRAADLDGDGDLDLISANGNSNNIGVFVNDPAPVSIDLNRNSIPDECEADCNSNRVPDLTEIANGSARDCNANGVPDDCETAPVFNLADQKAYGAGSPESVAAADLDGDLDLDLVGANFDSGDVSLFTNKGDATYAFLRNTSTGEGSTSVVAGDLEGDGDMDLAVANQIAGSVALLTNNGSARFTKKVLAVGPQPLVIAIGDIDGDGDNDLIVPRIGNGDDEFEPDFGDLSLFENNGLGSFVKTVLSSGSTPSSAAILDIDASGQVDLVVANGSTNRLSIMRGNGDGTFKDPLLFPTGGDKPSFASAADVDEDGDLDVAVTNIGISGANSNLVLLTNTGNLNVSFSAPLILAAGNKRSCVRAADLDLDGHVDLAMVGKLSPTLGILRNKGDGTFKSALEFPVGQSPYHLETADLDGDGDLDVAVANQGGGLSVLRNDSLPQAAPDCNGNGIPDSCDLQAGVSADLDADGIPDDCGREFHRGDVNGTGDLDLSDAIFLLNFLFIGGSAPRCLEAADTNNSGLVDLSDGISLLGFLFLGGSSPPEPGPPPSPCGLDPDGPGSTLGCEDYNGCTQEA